MSYDDLPWDKRERFKARAPRLNRLADLFGLVFRYDFNTEEAEPLVRADRLEVAQKDIGQP